MWQTLIALRMPIAVCDAEDERVAGGAAMTVGALTISSESRSMRPLAWAPWALAVAVTGWVAAVLTAPVLAAWPAAFVYGVSSLVCHQLPERSFYWGGTQFAVCARCTGIYIGAALAAGIAAVIDPARLMRLRPHVRTVLIAGAAPTIVTLLAEWSGVWPTSHVERMVAGLPLGASGMAVVAHTLNYGRWLPRRHAHPTRRP
jgi:uncharacterized membrane protein